MQTSLRKMGNSTGLIVPRALLGEIGLTTGAALDLRVEDGKLIATPVTMARRAGWAEAAQQIESEDAADEWRGFANEDDADLIW
jgi:antitoxin MazE